MVGFGGQRSSETCATVINLRETLANILDESEKQFTCLICSEIFRSPVTITCGHTFCKSCIEDWFATKENCPCCRQSCVEGPSEPIFVLEEYLKRTKPLIQQRMVLLADEEEASDRRRRLSTRGSGISVSGNDSESGSRKNLSDLEEKKRTKRDQVIAKFMTAKLSKVKNPNDRMKLESSLWILRTMISSGEPLEKLMEDLKSLNFEYVIRKYYKKKEVAFGQNLYEHEYVRQARTKQYYFVPPSVTDFLWILGMIFCTFILYALFTAVDNTDYEDLQQSLLRVLGVFGFYLTTFEELYENTG